MPPVNHFDSLSNHMLNFSQARAMARARGLSTIAEVVKPAWRLEEFAALRFSVDQGYFLGHSGPKLSDDLGVKDRIGDELWNGEIRR
ncbi:MAG: hypothetical protein ABL907_25230 [Hyphomicrobium sp.]